MDLRLLITGNVFEIVVRWLWWMKSSDKCSKPLKASTWILLTSLNEKSRILSLGIPKKMFFPIVVIWLLERFKCSKLSNLSNGDNFRKRFELMSNHRSFLQVLTLEIPEEKFVKDPTL